MSSGTEQFVDRNAGFDEGHVDKRLPEALTHPTHQTRSLNLKLEVSQPYEQEEQA